MSSHYSMYSLSIALSIKEENLLKIIKNMNEGIADQYFVFDGGEIKYRKDRAEDLCEFLKEKFTKLDKDYTIESQASFNSEISGVFSWDRKKPLPKGREFYCSPFKLKFKISNLAPISLTQALKTQNYLEEDRHYFGFRVYSKAAKTTEGVLELMNTFIKGFLELYAVNQQGPRKDKIIISDEFIDQLMHYEQSLKRYGLRPDES
jgi:hypothetical protein